MKRVDSDELFSDPGSAKVEQPRSTSAHGESDLGQRGSAEHTIATQQKLLGQAKKQPTLEEMAAIATPGGPSFARNQSSGRMGSENLSTRPRVASDDDFNDPNTMRLLKSPLPDIPSGGQLTE